MRRVMIVEDDPLLSIVEEKLVTKLGYEVIGKAKSGEETLNTVPECKPDILLMDVQLCGTIDGIETAKRLRLGNVNIPIIFLSGDDSPVVVKKAEEAGFIDFLLKPVTKTELGTSLSKAENSLKEKSQFAA